MEGTIDHGGPRREFFRILAMNLAEQYFWGPTDNKCDAAQEKGP